MHGLETSGGTRVGKMGVLDVVYGFEVKDPYFQKDIKSYPFSPSV